MKIQTALALVFFTLVPAAAAAETPNEQTACMGDAFSVCGHAIPDRDRVAACLAKNMNRISVVSRSVIQRYSKPMTATRAKLSTRD